MKSTQPVLRWIRKHPVTGYVGLAWLISWAAWLPLLATTQGWVDLVAPQWLHLLGGLGPATAAVVVVAAVAGRAGVRDLGRRLLAWRGRRKAWAFAILVPPGLLLVAAPITAAVGDSSLDWSAFGLSTEFAGLPLPVWWLINFVFFGIGEEVGWRGFLQPHLEIRHSRVTSAGLVSLPWALWHLPLFGITPSYRTMPVAALVGFAVSIWLASVIFAWLLQAGRGSLLVVAFFHAWFDIVTTSPLGPEALPTAMGVAITLVGLVLLRRLLQADAQDRMRSLSGSYGGRRATRTGTTTPPTSTL